MNVKRGIKMFKYFSVKELYSNCTPTEITESIRNNSIDCLLVLLMVLDKFRETIQKPIKIHSSYRDARHNKAVGGSSTSQHMLGEAIDFSCPSIANGETVKSLMEFLENTAFRDYIGQVIFYNTFIHIALRSEKHKKLCYYDKRNHQKSN